MTQTTLDLPDDGPREMPAEPQTPVTMERAFQFGFKAGLGFIAAQLLLGVIVAICWVLAMQPAHH